MQSLKASVYLRLNLRTQLLGRFLSSSNLFQAQLLFGTGPIEEKFVD